MNIKTLFAGFGLLAAQSLAAQNIFIAPVAAGTTQVAAGTFGGESKDVAHVGWANVSNASFSFENAGAARSTAGGGAGAGKVTPGNFVINKTMDGSSQFFFTNVTSGRVIPLMTIEYARPSEKASLVYQIVTLKDVRVVSFNQRSSEDGMPEEEIGLAYGSFEITYNRPDATGKLTAGKPVGWNFNTNVKTP